MDFGKTVKKAVERQNMLAWQFNTIGVSDAITMGGEGETPFHPFTPHTPFVTHHR